MCKKLFYLVFVFVLSFACTSYADVVIGDFEDGTEGWVATNGTSIDTSEIVATLGSNSLVLSNIPANTFTWAVQWEGLLDMTNAHTISVDITWVASEWDPQEGIWVNFKDLAINSDGPSGWSQYIPNDVVNPDWPGSWDPVNWGDQTRTLTYDISDYDASGATWMQVIFSSNMGSVTTPGNYYIDNVVLVGAEPLPEPEPTVPFSIAPVEDIELGNDEALGPDANKEGSGVNARELDIRRRVFLISYDISSLQGRVSLSNVSLNHFSHDQHAACNVYGVIEDLDLLEVESLTWNTAPGLQNDPAPALGTPVNQSLDMDDLTDVLLSFTGPGEKGIRFTTDTSDALADFINSDTDGILTLLFVADASTEGGDGMLVRSSEHEAGGTLLEGDIAPIANIIWVSDNTKYDFDADQPADAGFVDLLRAEGYIVDYRGEDWPYDPNDDNVVLNPDWLYWQSLDPNKIEELNAADLVIISRIANSGAYDDKPDSVGGIDECIGWNSVTTPMISMSAHLARSGYGKWGWHNTSGHPYITDNIHNILDPDHAIFAGIEVDPNGQADLLIDDYTVNGSDPADADAGNGVTLATRAADNAVMISYWDAGVEYFDGAGYFAGGTRMFFAAGSGNGSPRDGIYNLTADGETVFLNAVEYMLPPEALPMVAHWPMDEGAGTVVADVVGGNDGTLVGGVSWLADGGVSFDNIDGSHIEVPNADVLDFADESFTISMLVRYDVHPGDTDRWIIKGTHGGDGSGSRYEIFQTDGDEIRFAIDNGPDNIKSSLRPSGTNAAIITGDWVHVVAVRDAENDLMSLYADGVLLGTLADTSGDISSGEDMWIGESTDEENTATAGDIADVRIFNSALTEDQIGAIY